MKFIELVDTPDDAYSIHVDDIFWHNEITDIYTLIHLVELSVSQLECAIDFGSDSVSDTYFYQELVHRRFQSYIDAYDKNSDRSRLMRTIYQQLQQYFDGYRRSDCVKLEVD